MNKLLSFTRTFFGFYFGHLGAAFREAWKRTAFVATVLAIIIPAVVHFAKLRPGQEATLGSLVWQVPAVFFVSLVLLLLVYVPFSRFQKLEGDTATREKALADEIERLENAAKNNAKALQEEINQRNNFTDSWTQGKTEIARLRIERDSLRSRLEAAATVGTLKSLSADALPRLLDLGEKWSSLHNTFLHGVTDSAERQVKDLSDRTEAFLKKNWTIAMRPSLRTHLRSIATCTDEQRATNISLDWLRPN